MDYELKHEREELAGGITYCQDMLEWRNGLKRVQISCGESQGDVKEIE